jgi:hypothetical protein
LPEEYLQIAFEIKASCDDISRRLLRWHWEQKPGAHSLDSLKAYLEERRRESPDYYDRMPATEQKTSWQQLDTTFCMRVLLDPEKDAAHPLDLLGNMPRPGSARRACNAIRTARNEAAHAADRAGAIEAALRFNEAIECLEEGYVGLALSEADISRYYRAAEEYLARCKGEQPKAVPQNAALKRSAAQQKKSPEVNVYPTGRAREQTAAARSAAGKSDAARRSVKSGVPAASAKGGAQRKNAPKRAASATQSRQGGTKRKKAGKTSSRRQKGNRRISKLFVALAFLVLALGLVLRARTMGIF